MEQITLQKLQFFQHIFCNDYSSMDYIALKKSQFKLLFILKNYSTIYNIIFLKLINGVLCMLNITETSVLTNTIQINFCDAEYT